MTTRAVPRILAGAVFALLLFVLHPLAARADGDPVPDAYTYGASDCNTSTRTDPITLIFHGAAFNDPYRTRSTVEIVQDIESHAFPTSSGITGGTQYAHNGSGCSTQAWSFGREFGPPRTVQGSTFSHREKKHARFFNTRDSATELTVSGSPHRERKTSCNPPKDPGDAVYKRYNGQGGFDAAAQEQASVLRSEGYDVVRHPTISPVQTTFAQCNGFVVPWTGNVYRVNVPLP